jgi:hypothetical protein
MGARVVYMDDVKPARKSPDATQIRGAGRDALGYSRLEERAAGAGKQQIFLALPRQRVNEQQDLMLASAHFGSRIDMKDIHCLL